MPNLLDMADIRAIWALARQGWSQRRIARELGVDRETVARLVIGMQKVDANVGDSHLPRPGTLSDSIKKT